MVIRDSKGLTLFSADGEVVRRLGSQTDHSVGMAEDQSGLLVTINKNNGLKKMKVTDAGETDIFFIDPERDVVLKRVEMSFLVEEEEDAVKKHMRLSDLYQHGERLLAFDEGNRRVFSFHQEDGEDVVEILPTDERLGVLQFKVILLHISVHIIDFCPLPQKAEPLKSRKFWPILSRKLLPQTVWPPYHGTTMAW